MKLEISLEKSVYHRAFHTLCEDVQTVVGKDGGYPKLKLFVRRFETSCDGIGDAEIWIFYEEKLKSDLGGIGDTEISTPHRRTFRMSLERIGVAEIWWRTPRYP